MRIVAVSGALVAAGCAGQTGAQPSPPSGTSLPVTAGNDRFTLRECTFSVPIDRGWLASRSSAGAPAMAFVAKDGDRVFRITANALRRGVWRAGAPPDAAAAVFFDALQAQFGSTGKTGFARGEARVANRTVYTLRWKNTLPSGEVRDGTSYLVIPEDEDYGCLFGYDEPLSPSEPAGTRRDDVLAVIASVKP